MTCCQRGCPSWHLVKSSAGKPGSNVMGNHDNFSSEKQHQKNLRDPMDSGPDMGLGTQATPDPTQGTHQGHVAAMCFGTLSCCNSPH
jgi:hypothetical protein